VSCHPGLLPVGGTRWHHRQAQGGAAGGTSGGEGGTVSSNADFEFLLDRCSATSMLPTDELFSGGKLVLLRIPTTDEKPKVEKGVVGRARRGDTCQEGCGHVEEGENGWYGRLIHFWVTRARRRRMGVGYGSPVEGFGSATSTFFNPFWVMNIPLGIASGSVW
jgi:hypothetical protein